MAQYKHSLHAEVQLFKALSSSSVAAATVADVVRLSLHIRAEFHCFTHPYSTILLPPLSPTISSPDCCRHEHCVYNCCASIIHSCQESCPTESPLSTAANHALQHSTFAIDACGGLIYTNGNYQAIAKRHIFILCSSTTHLPCYKSLMPYDNSVALLPLICYLVVRK